MLAIRNLSVPHFPSTLPLCRVYKQLLKDSADYKDVAEGWKDLLQTTATNRSLIMLWETGNLCPTPLSTAAGTESPYRLIKGTTTTTPSAGQGQLRYF